MDWHDEQAKGCDAKTAMGHDAARAVAERARRDGNALSAYRCPWGAAKHWHVGHVPCIERVQEIADAIRARAQDPAA